MEKEMDEWELLPPNTSFLDFGLEDIKDLFSNEIDYMDYLVEQPPQQLKLIQLDQENQHKKLPLQQPIASYEEFLDIKVEDTKRTIKELSSSNGSVLKDNNTSIDKDKENSADKPRSRRRLVVGIGELFSIGAAVAAAMVSAFLLGNSRRQEQQRRAESLRFQIYTEDKALKQMVRQATRINQVLVATARGMPPSAMQPATISFGGCFDGI